MFETNNPDVVNTYPNQSGDSSTPKPKADPTADLPPLPKTPDQPAPPPIFGMSQGAAGKRPARKSTSTFIGSAGLQPEIGMTGQKTLLGQ